jgi:hypothetical protein
VHSARLIREKQVAAGSTQVLAHSLPVLRTADKPLTHPAWNRHI